MTAPDATWAARAKAGDRAAFAAIFTHYQSRIYHYCMRIMGNPADAADLTQEVFLRAYQAIERTDDHLFLSAWLHRIAANACKDVLRRQHARWLPWEGSRHDRASTRREDDPEAMACDAETRRAIGRTLGAMSPRNRQALGLRGDDDRSLEEIGALLGCSGSAVKSLLFRARQEFRAHYRGQEDHR